ncbi:MAG TPA: hypothetical protein PLS90_03845 [Candidatus Sumerlaeota bacterium]|nr:hypothetical protein [Candidatus Sumerlaeota bacterium]HPK01569.1 hypothetical protein [Candidatus Sumerlaeota bacterium]
MQLARFNIGDSVRLRERIHPGHPYARLDQRSPNRSDIPAGTRGIVRRSHGTTVMVELFPNPDIMTGRGIDVWVSYHMLVVLFAPDGTGAEGKDASMARKKSTGRLIHV